MNYSSLFGTSIKITLIGLMHFSVQSMEKIDVIIDIGQKYEEVFKEKKELLNNYRGSQRIMNGLKIAQTINQKFVNDPDECFTKSFLFQPESGAKSGPTLNSLENKYSSENIYKAIKTLDEVGGRAILDQKHVYEFDQPVTVLKIPAADHQKIINAFQPFADEQVQNELVKTRKNLKIGEKEAKQLNKELTFSKRLNAALGISTVLLVGTLTYNKFRNLVWGFK